MSARKLFLFLFFILLYASMTGEVQSYLQQSLLVQSVKSEVLPAIVLTVKESVFFKFISVTSPRES